jgi:hypothetical protein
MSATGSRRIDQAIADLDDWRGTTLATVRRVFRRADPAVEEEWKWMGTPTWECEGIIGIANAHAKKVKVTFSQGAKLDDPQHVFNAGFGGSLWRALDLFEGDPVPEDGLLELVRAAIRLNRAQAAERPVRRVRKAPSRTTASARRPVSPRRRKK